MERQSVRRRAVHEGQKEERRQVILRTAWQLFQTTSYEAVTMAGVAEAAGLAKGTLFLYFKTKEALFLALLEQQLEDWFAEVNAGLAVLLDEAGGDDNAGAVARSGENRIARVASLLSEQLGARPGLTRLLAILHTLLERNIGLDEALHFKYMLKEHFERTGVLLERCLPFLRPGEGAHMLLQCDAMVIGFWHLADAAPVVQQALQRPDLTMFEVQFAAELNPAIQALLYGLEKLAQEPSA